MKQHITPEQLSQLTDKGKERLREWWEPEDGNLFINIWDRKIEECTIYIVGDDGEYAEIPEADSLPLLSIGQMIQFIGDGWYMSLFGGHCCEKRTDGRGDIEGEPFKDYEGELCDALWSAVVEVLNKE